ncbi:MAG: hypothetical protein IMF17_05015 [Proteobacteria bacterium]|nr:hypothetical protein [Pseudomonadota bacterium]
MDTETFLNAKDSLKAQDYKAAERTFKKVLESIDEHHEEYNSVSSYYGLAQVLASNKNGLLVCRDAASNEVFDGEVFLNLACAEWHSNNRKRAVDAIRHGVKIDAGNTQLNHACAKLDCRKKCCFGFLPRGHKLNRIVGRLLRRPGAVTTVHSLLY